MSAFARFLLLGLLSMLLVGCRNGSDTPRPQILRVSPTGTAGVTTTTIDFVADVASDKPYTLHWHFGGGTEPSTSTHFTPTVTLLAPGTYPATVDLVIDATVEQTIAFEYTVAAPPAVTGVSPIGTVGATRAYIDFEATIDGEFDSLTWNFGASTPLLSQRDAMAHTRVLTAGDFYATVTASLDGVAGSVFPFIYTVTTPVPPTWLVDDVAPADASSDNIGMVEHLGRINIAFDQHGGVHIAQALKDKPHGPEDWQVHRVDDGLLQGAQNVVSRHDRLVLSYVTGRVNAQNGIAVAQKEIPTSESDWVTMDISRKFFQKQDGALQNDPQGPLWLVCDGGEFGLTVARCDAALPQVAADWQSHQMFHFDEPSLIFYSRLNSLLTPSGLRVSIGPGSGQTSTSAFGQSIIPIPAAASDWSLQFGATGVDTDSPVFPLPSESGKPLLLYRRFGDSLHWDALVVREGLTSIPASPADWVDHKIHNFLFVPDFFATDRRVGGFGGEFFGRAAYLHRDTVVRQLILYRQVGDEITNPEHWQIRPIPSGGEPTWAYSMLATDGRLVVAWIDKSRGMLVVAQADGPF